MPLTAFAVTVTLRGGNISPHLAELLSDFSPAFEAVDDRWLAGNRKKFEEARGAEGSGVSFDGDTIWQPDSPAYSAEKRRKGFDDWLMVRTGELMTAMTTKGAFGEYHDIDARSARFGLTDEPRDRARWNWDKRPVMFLDENDQQMIREMFGAFLNDQPPFKPWVPSQGRIMDAEFSEIINPLGGSA